MYQSNLSSYASVFEPGFSVENMRPDEYDIFNHENDSIYIIEDDENLGMLHPPEVLINLETNKSSVFNKLISIENKVDALSDIMFDPSDTLKACDSIWKNELIIRTYFIFLCIVQYLLPLIVLCVTYAIIAYYVYVINSKVDSMIDNRCHNNFLSKNKKKVALILFF